MFKKTLKNMYSYKQNTFFFQSQHFCDTTNFIKFSCLALNCQKQRNVAVKRSYWHMIYGNRYVYTMCSFLFEMYIQFSVCFGNLFYESFILSMVANLQIPECCISLTVKMVRQMIGKKHKRKLLFCFTKLVFGMLYVLFNNSFSERF